MCDNDFGRPLKTFPPGRGRVVGQQRAGPGEAQGQRAGREWAPGGSAQGQGGRRCGRNPGATVSEGGQGAGEGEPGRQGPGPLPVGLGKSEGAGLPRASWPRGPLGSGAYLHINELLPINCRRHRVNSRQRAWLALPSLYLHFHCSLHLPPPPPDLREKKKKPIKITILCLQICRSFSLMKDA